MMKMFALARTKEEGEASIFIAGPTPILSNLFSYISEEGQNELFVIEENKEPRWVDLDFYNDVSL